mmetsp:Transcript_27483/g.89538  ORF Transcript_27483/g.89538 Transcript_27483/m.89538 type:complete len:101 (+) Transcript_27483:409-711(+)
MLTSVTSTRAPQTSLPTLSLCTPDKSRMRAYMKGHLTSLETVRKHGGFLQGLQIRLDMGACDVVDIFSDKLVAIPKVKMPLKSFLAITISFELVRYPSFL